MKRCTCCGETKPRNEYHRDRQRKDGLFAYCKPCNKARARQWRVENRDKAHATARAWRERNPEQKRAADLRYRVENKDRLDRYFAARRAARKADQLRGLERVCMGCGEPIPTDVRLDARYCCELCRKRAEIRRANHRRRARIKGALVEDVDPVVVLERDDGVCGICGGDADPFDFHLDHIVPLACGGEHSYANVQVAHPQCNLVKSDLRGRVSA